MTSPLQGKPAPLEMLANIPELITQYYTNRPNPSTPEQRVSFGTSGHRGSSLKNSFTETHIKAIVQAICDCRAEFGATGPLFLGMDTHALSTPAHQTAISVLAANGVTTFIAPAPGYTPTPVISRSIIRYNQGNPEGLADGIVITPSHNPPEDGGIKYNATHGGPSGEEITRKIAHLANKYIESGNKQVKFLPLQEALNSSHIRIFDYLTAYVEDLEQVIDFNAIRNANLHLGADALGGSGLAYWPKIAEKYHLDITVRNHIADPTFRFMCLDHDGKIRMDCSSPNAMASLVAMQNQFDLGFANDPDFDRHGIVCPGYGLMNPNHYLATAIRYLIQTRHHWKTQSGIGKTVVSSMMIDKVVKSLKRPLMEVPVGFKWFVSELSDASISFGGEESAGASFLKKDGGLWTTDKDGIILDLLAAEMLATTGKTPGEHYKELEHQFGTSYYTRVDSKATAAEKKAIASLDPLSIPFKKLGEDPIVQIITRAPGNLAPIGGVKIIGENSWAAIRPSGTEDVCKIYAESLISKQHLQEILQQASQLLKA